MVTLGYDLTSNARRDTILLRVHPAGQMQQMNGNQKQDLQVYQPELRMLAGLVNGRGQGGGGGMELSVGNDHRNGPGMGDLHEEMAHEELFVRWQCSGEWESQRVLWLGPLLHAMVGTRSTRKWKAN